MKYLASLQHCLLPLLLLLPLGLRAQNGGSPARDSLQAATDRLAYHPDSLPLRLEKAAWNVELEQWEYAKNEYDYVLDHDPDNLAALYYRAFVNQKLRRYGFARLDYEHLLKLYPGYFEGQLGLALLNDADNRKTEALDQINNIVANFPDSAVAWAVRGGMEMDRQMYDVAVYDYAEAIRLDPVNRNYRLSRVEALLALRRNKEARKELDTIVRQGTPRKALAEWYRRCENQ
ncbi:MAG: tetratricopeptide repeat protein [Prevotella sp.]|jgi:tetratricopeptide (TPR) repeat protein